MLRAKKVNFIKALTLSAILAKGGIGTEEEKNHLKGTTKDNYNQHLVERDRDNHIARLVSSLMHISGEGDQVRNGLRPIPASWVLSQYKRELDKLKHPMAVDMNAVTFDKLISYLEAARFNSIKLKLTLNDIKAAQLNEILWDYPDAIEEINLTYEETPPADEDDWDEGTTPKGKTSGYKKTKKDDSWDDDSWDEDDWDEGTTPEGETSGYKKTKKDDSWDDDSWDDEEGEGGPGWYDYYRGAGFDPYDAGGDDWEGGPRDHWYDYIHRIGFYPIGIIDAVDVEEWDVDDFGIAHPRPVRAARGRDPLRLYDLMDNPNQGLRRIPNRNRVVRPVNRVLLPINNANAHDRIVEGQPNAIAPIVNINNFQDDSDGSNNVSWKMTVVKNESQDNGISSNILSTHGLQSHALVKMFCRGNRGA
jgi:hypothetical protein